jgi:hypothetical protein
MSARGRWSPRRHVKRWFRFLPIWEFGRSALCALAFGCYFFLALPLADFFAAFSSTTA